VEARKLLVLARGSDDDDGTNSNSKGLVEYLRRDRNGKPVDARYALVGRDQATTTRVENGYGQQLLQPWGAPWDDRNRWAQPQRPASGGFFGLFGQRDDWQQQQYQQQQQQYQPQYQQQFQQQYQQRLPSYLAIIRIASEKTPEEPTCELSLP